MDPSRPTERGPAAFAADPVPADAVRDQLARIVSSAGFVASPRLCRFLTHAVERTLAGETDSLKEFAIAMDVFDRTSDYDPNIDAIVRVEARRLRTKLKAYYETEAGSRDPVLLGLRPGSYVPVFRWVTPPSETLRTQIEVPGPTPSCIAVLPFVNMSPEPEQDYFCDGITEEITDSLTRVQGLKVIARTSAFRFKGVNLDVRDVGQQLGADLIIEGSVRKAGDQLRITAQMIQAESGHHLWSETFRRDLKDIFQTQEEIAQSVTELLRLHRPKPDRTGPPSAPTVDAYTRYLHARFLIHQQTPEALSAAAAELRTLIRAYPQYAPAYCGLAFSEGLLAQFGLISGRDAFSRVQANAERAYELAPDSAESCVVLASFRAWFERRWQDANRLFDRALELQPSDAAAHRFRAMALLCQRNIDVAESGLQRSAELNPLSASDCARFAYISYVKGDDTSAARHLRRAFELDRDYPEARLYEGLSLYKQRQYETVIQCFSGSADPLEIGLLGAAHAQLGNSDDAKRSLEQLDALAAERYVTPLAAGLCAIGMQDKDAAFASLDAAVEHRTNFVNLLAVEPFFSPLSKDRRFPALLDRLNLLS